MPIHVKVLSQPDYSAVGRRAQEGDGGQGRRSEQGLGRWPTCMARGEKVYAANCAVCHQPNGKGGGADQAARRLAGRRSTPTRPSSSTIVLNGAANGAMPAWKQLSRHRDRGRRHLHQEQLVATRPARSCSRPKSRPPASNPHRSEDSRNERSHECSARPRPRGGPRPRRPPRAPRRAARLAALAVRDQPQGHRHDVPVVHVHDAHGRRRAGAGHPRSSCSSRACSSSTRSCSTSSRRCTA